jgi:hypothetical protein
MLLQNIDKSDLEQDIYATYNIKLFLIRHNNVISRSKFLVWKSSKSTWLLVNPKEEKDAKIAR